MEWITWLGGGSGIAALILAISTFKNQRKQAELNKQKQKDDYTIRKQELDSLEHKMVIDLGKQYQSLVIPLQARIEILETKIEDCNKELELAEAENNELRQTNDLYEKRIKFLEETLETLNAKHMSEAARLQKQIQAQNRKINNLTKKLDEKES